MMSMPSTSARQFGRGPMPSFSRHRVMRSRIASICCGVSIAVFFSGVGSRVTSRTGFVGIASSRTANPQMSDSTERAFRADDTPRSARRFWMIRSQRPTVSASSVTPPQTGTSVRRTVVS